MVTYADTSFFVSLYGRDANSACAQQAAAQAEWPFAYTPLLRLEARNAIRLAHFRKELTVSECRRVIEAIEADVLNSALAQTPVPWPEVFAEAETLSAGHTGTLGMRAFDILHVAAAVTLGAKAFYTFDVRQKALAKKAGLKVLPV